MYLPPVSINNLLMSLKNILYFSLIVLIHSICRASWQQWWGLKPGVEFVRDISILLQSSVTVIIPIEPTPIVYTHPQYQRPEWMHGEFKWHTTPCEQHRCGLDFHPRCCLGAAHDSPASAFHPMSYHYLYDQCEIKQVIELLCPPTFLFLSPGHIQTLSNLPALSNTILKTVCITWCYVWYFSYQTSKYIIKIVSKIWNGTAILSPIFMAFVREKALSILVSVFPDGCMSLHGTSLASGPFMWIRYYWQLRHKLWVMWCKGAFVMQVHTKGVRNWNIIA